MKTQDKLIVGSVYLLKKGNSNFLFIPTLIVEHKNPNDGDHDDVKCLKINLQNQNIQTVYREINFLLDNCEKLI